MAVRIWEERDPVTHQLIAIHQYINTYEQKRTIWMDGRPHPSPNAPHTWMGFSTGVWDGNRLTITTTHIKQGWFRRENIPSSDEATTIEHWVRNGRVWTHVSVTDDPVFLTERLVRTQLGEYDWLHVATHARVAEEATASSYLLLARGLGGSDDDGLLTAEEVQSLPLDGATIVLSACGTALGRISGEGTFGFTRSFLAAGARTVVATTWEMPDTAALRMMNAFYARLRDQGLTVSAALRAAQLHELRALRAGRVTMTAGTQNVRLPSTPLLWAGYVAVGVP